MASHSTPNISVQVLEAVWTKFEAITSPTSRLRPEKQPKSPFTVKMSVKVTDLRQNGDFVRFLGFGRLLGLVRTSNLVQTASNTCLELCGVL